MEFKTFAGKVSKLLDRPNSQGRLPISDQELAARGWTLASLEYLKRKSRMGGPQLILAVPIWTQGDKSVVPSRLKVRSYWELATVPTFFDQSAKNRGLVWIRTVANREEILAEASHFFRHARVIGTNVFDPSDY